MYYIGLLTEIIFFCGGIYLYLFATGRIKFNNFEAEAKAARIRKENGNLLRILSLAVAAIMAMNIFVSLRDLF